MFVTPTSEGFELLFPYNAKIIEDVKAIPRAKWDPARKIWIVPLTEHGSVRWLQRKYPASPADRAALNKAARRSEPEVFGKIPDMPHLDIEIPLKKRLFEYQTRGTAYALAAKRCIIGDEPGLGKTYQAIAAGVAAAENFWPALIICPASLKLNWQRELMALAGIRAVILDDSVRTTWPQYLERGIAQAVIVNYESLKKFFVLGFTNSPGEAVRREHIKLTPAADVFKAVIVDELHKCKDPSTRQAKITNVLCRGREYVFGLTGTPVVNQPRDLASQLDIIQRLVAFGGYARFVDRYCGSNGKGASNLRELNYKLWTTCFFQRRKKDVLTDLPDKMRKIVLCDISTRREYDAAVADLAGYLREYKEKTDAQIRKSLAGEIMVKIGVCKAISARGKLAEVFEYIDECLEAGVKLGVFVHQREIGDILLKRYAGRAVGIRGGQTMGERDSYVQSFQNNPEIGLAVCSVKAAGVGLTLTASSRCAFVEFPWHPADSDQCEDRFHRIGQKNAVQALYFIGKDTIDEVIWQIIEEKRGVANTVTGSEDSVQREIISRLSNELFNKPRA